MFSGGIIAVTTLVKYRCMLVICLSYAKRFCIPRLPCILEVRRQWTASTATPRSGGNLSRAFLLTIVAIAAAFTLISDVRVKAEGPVLVALNIQSESHCIPENQGDVIIKATFVSPAPEFAYAGIGHS